MINFAKNFYSLRRSNEYTQEQIAERVGVSRQAVTKWEAGSSTPDIYKLVDIAEIFKCTVDELICGATGNSVVDESYKTVAEKILGEIRVLKNEFGRNRIEPRDVVDLAAIENFDFINDENTSYTLESFAEQALKQGEMGDAIDFLEESLLRGNIDAVFRLCGLYQERIRHFHGPVTTSDYIEEVLHFGGKIQGYGRIIVSIMDDIYSSKFFPSKDDLLNE